MQDGIFNIYMPKTKNLSHDTASIDVLGLLRGVDLVVSLPMRINGKFIDTGDPNCIVHPNSPSLSLNAEFLSNYSGCTIHESI